MHNENPTGVGSRYCRLTVLRPASPKASLSGKLLKRWRCLCDCGTKRTVQQSSLRSGATQSCGCLLRERTTRHGLSSHPLYACCSAAINRCHNPSAQSYSRYGDRGIKVYSAWRHDVALMVRWLESNLPARKPGMSLDRIDNDKGYRPGNLRWSTVKDQARNRRTTANVIYKGRSVRIADLADRKGVDPERLRHRINDGHSVLSALHYLRSKGNL